MSVYAVHSLAADIGQIGVCSTPTQTQDAIGALPTTSLESYIRLFDYLHEHGIPAQRITRSAWDSLYAVSLASKVRSGCRFLGLTVGRENRTKRVLARVVNPTERRDAFGAILRQKYGNVIPTAQKPDVTRHELEEAFSREFGVQGQTAQKAVMFFLAAAEFVGIPVASSIARAPVTTLSDSTLPFPSASVDAGSEQQARSHNGFHKEPEVSKSSEPAKESPTMLHTPLADTGATHPIMQDDPRAGFLYLVQGLVHRIPPSGRWKKVQRDRLVQAIEANLDALVEIEDEEGTRDG